MAPPIMTDRSGSIVGSFVGSAAQVKSGSQVGAGSLLSAKGPGEYDRINRKSVWGLYCMYALIGMFNGFWFAYLNSPICQYLFGPVNTPGHTHTQQCNISVSMYQMPWNFKVFFAFFLDKFSFFGSRRRGWIVFGWTAAFILLIVVAIRAPALLAENHADPPNGSSAFNEYTFFIMAINFCFIFSDVAGDGMTIELSKLEPPENRGYILSTGQMVRFGFMVGNSLIGMFAMSGPSWQNPAAVSDKGHWQMNNSTWSCPYPGGVQLDGELSFANVHWLLIGVGAPFFLAMCVLLRDPPPPEDEEHDPSAHGFKGLWRTMKSYAVFMLIMQNFTNICIAQLINPASLAIQQITSPDPFQTSIGNIIAYSGLVGGIFVFRKYLMNRNWRYTQVGTGVLIGLAGILNLMMVWNVGEWGQTGWFFIIGSNGPQVIVGLQQVLSSLAVVEISPPGLEATVYELITTVHNYCITLCSVLSNLFIAPFALSQINTSTYCNITDQTSHPGDYPSKHDQYESMLNATWMAIGVNVVGAVISTFFIPRSKEHCKSWVHISSWHNNKAALLNAVLVLGPFAYAVTLAFMQMFSNE